MGDLLDIEQKKLHPTLTKLEQFGACIEDFDLIRRFDSFAAEVVLTLRSLRLKMALMKGRDMESALVTVATISDVGMLVDVVKDAPLVEVRVAAVNRIPIGHSALHDIARLQPYETVVSAAVGRIDNWSTVWMLVCCDGNSGWRQKIFKASFERRFGHSEQKSAETLGPGDDEQPRGRDLHPN